MIKSRNESAIVIGDLNKLVGDIVPGNHTKVSYGGQLVRDLIETEEYILVNSTDVVNGGPYRGTNLMIHLMKTKCLVLIW